MATSLRSLGIDKLSVDQRLALVDEIWASIATDGTCFPLTDAQRAELERRVADDNAAPDDTVSWTEIKEIIRARLAQ